MGSLSDRQIADVRKYISKNRNSPLDELSGGAGTGDYSLLEIVLCSF